jgi:hypothetical protein
MKSLEQRQENAEKMMACIATAVLDRIWGHKQFLEGRTGVTLHRTVVGVPPYCSCGCLHGGSRSGFQSRLA